MNDYKLDINFYPASQSAHIVYQQIPKWNDRTVYLLCASFCFLLAGLALTAFAALSYKQKLNELEKKYSQLIKICWKIDESLKVSEEYRRIAKQALDLQSRSV